MAKKVSIKIRDNSTGKYYKVPVLPQEITFAFGAALKDSVTIVNLGTVDFHSGNELDSFAWESFFPENYDANYCTTSDLLTPKEYQKLFESWKTDGVSLQLICPAAGINKAMTLYTFTPTFKGADMDCYYSLEFKERRVVKAVKVDLGAMLGKKGKKTAASRPSTTKKSKPKTYTVKAGDSLTRIAKTYGISPWRTLYNNNKSVVGADPNRIQVGMVLKL